ncbi:hypothetical protein DPMN_049073 [Dreissena polymorpha]|uniref:Ras-associating domain-containing protein n=1 Tax=Dreissena polymorpha TaxID=45954 RepID=A0A9D4DCN6_DREPO|nr:hypothetical protein DPMN_049073 [Dreissena polymorpha]
MTHRKESTQIAVDMDGVRMRCHISRHTTCYDVIRGITSEDDNCYVMFECRKGIEKILPNETRVYKRVRSRIDNSVTNFVLKKISKLASKKASIDRARRKLQRIRSKLFDSERVEGSSLENNLNNRTPLRKCYSKNISSVYRVPPIKSYNISLPQRTRADGAVDVTRFELPERTPGDGMEVASTNVSCDMDVAFLCDDGHVLSFEVSECDSRLDDVSVTLQVDSAFDEDDTMCELEKNVFDVNDDVSFRTLTRLRSMFSDGGNVDAIADDSAMDSFMRD